MDVVDSGQIMQATWHLELDKDTGIPIVTITGRLTLDGFGKSLDRIRRNPSYRGSDRSLWDLRGVFAPSVDAVRTFAALAQGTETRSCRRAALVVEGEVQYGLARMFQILSEQSGSVKRVFRDLTEARIWLCKTPEAEVLPSARFEKYWGYSVSVLP